MERNETGEFVGKLDNDAVLLYENRLLESLKSTNRQILILTKWMALLVIIYYLINFSDLNAFNFLGVAINDLNVMVQVVPPLISVLFLIYIKILFYKNDVQLMYKRVFSKLYNIEYKDVVTNQERLDPFVRLITPFAYVYEVMDSKGGCLNRLFQFIITSPILIVQLIPLIFVIQGTYNTFSNYWDTIFGKICVLFGLWGILLGIFCFFKTIIMAIYNEFKYKANLE